MRRKAFSWLEAVVVLVILAILAAILFPVFGRRRESKRDYCQSNLKQIALGIKQYVQDYDEKFPLVNSGKEGWMDIIQPYIKSVQLFQCTRDSSGYVVGMSDYFYNARLAGQSEEKFEYISNTILNGDGVPDSPPNVSLLKLPTAWATDQKSPSWRHLEGANYAYADGHVKWLRPGIVSNEKASSSNSTFAPW